MSNDSTTKQIQKFLFHGDELDVVALDGGDVGLSLRRLCDALPVDPDAQARRLAREAEKGARWATTVKMTVVAEDGKRREMLVIPRRSVPMFAATISLGSVREEQRPGIAAKLARYQDECADALADRFIGRRDGQGITIEVLAAALAPFAKGFEALSLGFAAMNDRLAALEQRSRDGEIMSRERSNALKARVRSCALDLSKYGNEKRRAASLRMHKRLKMKVGWFGDHCRLDNMPARYEADVLREMEIIEHETRGSVTASRQMSFPPLRAVNVNGKRTSA